MRKSLLILFVVLFSATAFSQTKADDKDKPKERRPAGYMGLWDCGAAVGYLNSKLHHDYIPTGYTDDKESKAFLLVHAQESMLSNYIWAQQQDKRIKFGITETLDLGCSYGTTRTVSDDPASNKSKTSFGFLFGYEGGVGAVYRINNNMDFGTTYYVFVASSFTPNRRFAKIRFRYSHYMAEISAFGKTAIDLKYVSCTGKANSYDRTMSRYIGFSYIPQRLDNGSVTPAFAFASYGFIF